MSPAEQHIRMVLSIFLSLIMFELITKVRVAADSWGKPSFHWLPFAWAAMIVLIAAQLWWFLFGYLDRSVWSTNFFAFLELLLSPALLYVSAAALFPTDTKSGAADLGEHFYARRRWIFFPLAAYSLEPMLGNLLAGGTLLRPQTAFQLLFAGTGIAAGITANRRFHTILPFAILAVVLVFIVLFRPSLG